MRPMLVMALAAPAIWGQSEASIRQSVMRAMPVLERSADGFVAKRACISCHHNILPILLNEVAHAHGVAFNSAILRAVEDKTFRQLLSPAAQDEAIQATTLNDPTPNDSFLLMAAHAAGLPPTLTTAVYARRLARWERDGHWVTSDFRPPHSSSEFTATATAIRAIRLYLPTEARVEGEAAIGRARIWLARTRPLSTEDASFRLLGLVWADAAPAERNAAARDLEKMALPSGGWAELPRYPADAYSTGEALLALQEAGESANDTSRKGIHFLLTSQATDGTWRVRTRMLSPAQVSPEYFTTGFPYQKDEYISYAGSCWAVIALLQALPEAEPPRKGPPPSDTEPGWIRTALFGSAAQLAAELDRGLDPNRKTENGTTLLMMAAPDPEKVRLLLARGADAKTRAKSGCDALTIAAAYRGTAVAMQTLLEAGALPQPPAGVRARNTPLMFAALTGDLENVNLLLAHGANPSAAALSSAVTFGYTDVVRTLIAAGASVEGTEASGINLLHWAAITNRAAIIPILVQAGAALNAIDEKGYTPLMYAATIDFGDTAVLRALLQAGADRNIRNADGRTPKEQARHYAHSHLETALR